jgi:hypothetical protein
MEEDIIDVLLFKIKVLIEEVILGLTMTISSRLASVTSMRGVASAPKNTGQGAVTTGRCKGATIYVVVFKIAVLIEEVILGLMVNISSRLASVTSMRCAASLLTVADEYVATAGWQKREAL